MINSTSARFPGSSLSQQRHDRQLRNGRSLQLEPKETSSTFPMWMSSEWLLPEVGLYEELATTGQWSPQPQVDSRLEILTFPTSSTTLSSQQQQQQQQQLAFCNLVTLAPFSYELRDDFRLHANGYEAGFATLLAMHHFNHADGSIIEQLEDVRNNNCNIRLVPEFIETMSVTSVAVDQVIQRLEQQSKEDKLLQNSSTITPHNYKLSPCAFLGEWRSVVSQHTSVVTALGNFIQMSGISTHSDLENKILYPKFTRTIPSNGGEAEAFVQYLKQVLPKGSGQSPFLAILNFDNEWSNTYASRVRQAVEMYAPELMVKQIIVDLSSVTTISNAIQELARIRFPVVLGAFLNSLDPTAPDQVMTEAYRQGVAGHGNTTWFFPGEFQYSILQGRDLEKGSPLHLAYRGSGLVSVGGRYPGNTRFQKLERALLDMKNDPEVVALAGELLPKYYELASDEINDPNGRDEDSFYRDSYRLMHDETFLNPLIDDRVQFVYEAVVSLGLAACRASNLDTLVLDPEEFYNRTLQTTFQAISGLVVFGRTGTRHANSTSYMMENIVEFALNETHFQFQRNVSAVFKHGMWTETAEFIYNDGSTTFPVMDRWVSATVLIPSRGVCVVSFILCGLAILLSFACAGFTWQKRNTRIIKSSQPFFLYAICFGTFVFATAIIPITLSRSFASSSKCGCTRACTSSAWLVFSGFGIVFSMIFSKTYRIKQIMKNSQKFLKIKVKMVHVLIPSLCVLAANVIILSIMTALKPIPYGFYVLENDLFGRPSFVYGRCSLENHKAYLIPLIILNLGIFLAALVQAWHVRHLSTEFQESKSLMRAVVVIMLVMAVGFPVLYIGRENPGTSLFMNAAIIFVMCASILLLLFVPKYYYIKQNAIGRCNVIVTGLMDCNSPSSEIEENNLNASAGDYVWSNKTARELAVEVKTLRKRIREMESQMNRTDHDVENAS